MTEKEVICNMYFAGQYGGPSGAHCHRPIPAAEPHEHRGMWMGLPVSAPWLSGRGNESVFEEWAREGADD